jgi:Domain of unknown function (DUF4202)
VRSLNTPFERATAAIDTANADDPNLVDVQGALVPLALAHGRLATKWALVLDPRADESILLACRAHHLRRWEVPRSTYPEGKAGYLRWRKDQKARHAADVADLLLAAGYEQPVVEGVQSLIRREHLPTDPAAQVVEDAACLVFLETQLDSFAAANEHGRVLDVIRRTARKMSSPGRALIGQIGLSQQQMELLTAALSGDSDGAA